MALSDQDELMFKQKCQHQIKQGTSSPVEKLRLYCLSRGVAGIRSIAVYFRQVDNNRDKKLDFEEFQGAFKEAGIQADAVNLKEAFDSVDADSNGKINFDEFLIALRGSIPESRMKLINKAFDVMDSDKSGTITLKDIRGKYSGRQHPKYINGEWTEAEVLQNWLRQFGGCNNDEITREDFINYYVGVSSSIDDNAYFDLMMRNAWKM